MATPTHFSAPSMIYHWVMAALIFSVGLTSPFLDHLRWPALSIFHNWGGALILVLAIGWFILRRLQPIVPNSSALHTREQNGVNIIMRVIDVLMVAAPVSGLAYLYVLIKPEGIGSTLPPSPTLYCLGTAHHVLSALLVSIAGAHSLHAVWHHAVKHDGYFGRMWPGHDASSREPHEPTITPPRG